MSQTNAENEHPQTLPNWRIKVIFHPKQVTRGEGGVPEEASMTYRFVQPHPGSVNNTPLTAELAMLYAASRIERKFGPVIYRSVEAEALKREPKGC